MQVAASTRLWAEHRHSWLQTQHEGRVLGSVHSVHLHLPQCSQSRRCFFSAGEEGITANPCWPAAVPPGGTLAGLWSRVFEEAEEVRTLDSEEAKQPGLQVEILPTGCRWWSTVGVGAAWSRSLWSDDVLLLLLMELGLPLKEIQG